MKHFFDNGHKVLLVTDVRGNNFIKNYSEFKSYILKSGTLTNKNFFIRIQLSKSYCLITAFKSYFQLIYINVII